MFIKRSSPKTNPSITPGVEPHFGDGFLNGRALVRCLDKGRYSISRLFANAALKFNSPTKKGQGGQMHRRQVVTSAWVCSQIELKFKIRESHPAAMYADLKLY